MSNRRNAIYLLIIANLLVALLTGRAIFFNIAYLFGGVLIIAFFWAWFSVRGISIGRATRSRRSQVGHTFSEHFRVRNRLYVPKLWLEIRDHSDLPGHQISRVVPSLASRSSIEWDVETPCSVRGEFRLGPLSITSGDPFGLFAPSRRLDATERVIVYPQMVNVPAVQLPIGLMTGGEAQRYMTQNVTTNAAGVRDYVPGDSINRIHWKSTARRGKLIVKEFELDPMVDIWMFVDFSSQSVYEDPSVRRRGHTGNVIPANQTIPASTEEYSVVAAASLANHFVDLERALGFVAYTPRREVLYPERGQRQLTRILETLAVARSFAQESLAEMLAQEALTFKRGTTLVLVTASVDKNWIAEAQTLKRRGIRLLCIFVDPTSFGSNQPSDEVRGMLQLSRIPTIVVRRGNDLTTALTQRPI